MFNVIGRVFRLCACVCVCASLSANNSRLFLIYKRIYLVNALLHFEHCLLSPMSVLDERVIGAVCDLRRRTRG